MKIQRTIKIALIYIICLLSYSATFAATTPKWEMIFNQLKDDWRTDIEIKAAMEDLWYKAEDYFWKKINSDISITKTSETTVNNSYNFDWEYKTTYTSRSCKSYDIEYINSLDVYSSPNLQKNEYFFNTEYLERYIDSKNPQKPNCPQNWWRISNPYDDKSNSSERYTAPNWKVYFIKQQNWLYSSDEMNKKQFFQTLNEIKSYIRNRNSLTYMWNNKKNNQNQNIQTTHNSAETDEKYECIINTLTNNLTNPVSFNVWDTDKKVVFDWTYTVLNNSTTIWWFSIYWDHLSTGDTIDFYVSIDWKYFSGVTVDKYWNIGIRNSHNLIKINKWTANVKVEAKYNGTNYNKTYNFRIRLTPSGDCDLDWNQHMTNLAPITIKN